MLFRDGIPRAGRPAFRITGAQGRGLGRALVRHGLARARADGCPAFLETGTPRNVPFYESFGFQVVGEQQAPDGGPAIWFMQTRPAPS
jgi:predicted N-acetyltransferase YhbS